ncbi:MAG: hypothetical protein JRI23_09020 [Deltaproteobacteria bacterium]|jgi:hypothetical protein|nr:hypothetical protein [Deltaproteobacteria bacterium]MBW2531779.1 hypothetical protein [Deltaproteobacteria bacterium]
MGQHHRWVLALSLTVLSCGAANGEPCDVGDDCSSEYCFVATPDANEGVCQDPPAACEDDITCDCSAISEPCGGSSHLCVAQTKSGVTITCL